MATSLLSSFGEEYGRVGRTVCYCWPGAMAGAVQEVIDVKGLAIRVKGKEAKCKSREEGYCEFVVAPNKKLENKR